MLRLAVSYIILELTWSMLMIFTNLHDAHACVRVNVMSTWTAYCHIHIYIHSHIDSCKYSNYFVWVISAGLALACLNKGLIVDEWIAFLSYWLYTSCYMCPVYWLFMLMTVFRWEKQLSKKLGLWRKKLTQSHKVSGNNLHVPDSFACPNISPDSLT